MKITDRIEGALARTVNASLSEATPPRLAEAVRYAMQAGGGRVRPKLLLAVAEACGNENPEAAMAAAVAIESLHTASLVHDDMPIFDDAETRRGRPTVHRKFGDEIALLVGDGLIVMAFEAMAGAARHAPGLMVELTRVMGRAVGIGRGIIAGQAWESEAEVNVAHYHRAKTGALFEAATVAGAVAGGGRGEDWRRVGQLIGEAYQVADDIADVAGDELALGKPKGQDNVNHRPSAVEQLGLQGAVQRLDGLITEATIAVPMCAGRDQLVKLLRQVGERLCPPEVRQLSERAAQRPYPPTAMPAFAAV